MLHPEVQDLDDLDVADLVADFHARLNNGDMKKTSQRVRPEHKFHKKRKEKRRIKHKGAGENKDVGGQGFSDGQKRWNDAGALTSEREKCDWRRGVKIFML